ncbi:MAG: GTP 3',8-cyclase [Cyclobacteriaceae bacterium]|nr:MAG: GTP 3',8-cyclase [Cyclobacteriaceae bacterium]
MLISVIFDVPMAAPEQISQVFDNHGRPINYVRLAVTDRCNLRCFYCMPAEGINYVPKKELLSYEEMERLLSVLASLGVTKLRITGGEPFVRQNLIEFLQRVSLIQGLEQIHITTNGVLTMPFIPALKKIGISSLNLSIDTLDRERFKQITRRDEVQRVEATMYKIIESGIPLKINAVVIEGKNEEDITALAELTRDLPIGVRFIEEMPFNGKGANYPKLKWNYQRILSRLTEHFGPMTRLEDKPHATSTNYRINGFKGSVGVIPAFSRTFCGSCNRIRITSQGLLKTCLYDHGVLDIKHLLRNGASDPELKESFLRAFRNRAKDGFEAESKRSTQVAESMSEIGG